LSRILWLDGVEGHNANTRHRFIYIHGTKHEDKIGQPDSHGCIRMRKADVIELYDLVDVGTPVRIAE
jgi:lipoprotein-anchoring transpeptidase ErfK/SrfK